MPWQPLSQMLCGQPPVCTSTAFRDWLPRYFKERIDQQTRVGTTTRYYVDPVGGSDSNNGTSEATPFKTVTKVNTIIAAWNNAPAGIRFSFKRGTVTRELVTLGDPNDVKDYIEFDSYGDTTLPRAEISFATLTYVNSGWSTSVNRSDAYSLTYSRTEATVISCFKESKNHHYPYVRCTTIADVDATEGSWYQNTGTNTLYVHPRGNSNMGFAGRTYEAIPRNQSLNVRAVGNNNVVRNLVLVGGGCDHITQSNSGSNCCCAGLMHNVDCWIGSHHNTVGGGTMINVRMGWTSRAPGNLEVTGANHVFYIGAADGAECAAYNVNVLYGGLPTFGGSNISGSAFNNHSNGTAEFGFLLYWNCTCFRNKFMVRTIGGGTDMPTWTDLKDCRAFFVEMKFQFPKGLTIGATSLPPKIEGGASIANGVCVNCQFEGGIVNTNAQHSNLYDTLYGDFINCKWTGDFTETMMDTSNFRQSFCAAAMTGHIVSSEITIKANGQRQSSTNGGLYGWSRDVVNIGVNTPMTGTLTNSIVRIDGPQLAVGYLAWNNDATKINNNLYVGLTDVPGDNRGYANDANKVAVFDSVDGFLPLGDSNLMTTIQPMLRGYRVEYDANWQIRNPFNTARGPFEVVKSVESLDQTTILSQGVFLKI